MKKLQEKLINDPNISQVFAKALKDEEKGMFCYCGGLMIPHYDFIHNRITLICNKCGKDIKLYADLGEQK